MYEGRDASAEFNVDAYLSANADLQAIYESLGNDDGAILNLVQHYIMCGEAEGRIATVADATASGITVVSAIDETKVIAAPAKSVYLSNDSSSYSAPTNDAPVINSVAEAEAAGYYSDSVTQDEHGKLDNLW